MPPWHNARLSSIDYLDISLHLFPFNFSTDVTYFNFSTDLTYSSCSPCHGMSNGCVTLSDAGNLTSVERYITMSPSDDSPPHIQSSWNYVSSTYFCNFSVTSGQHTLTSPGEHVAFQFLWLLPCTFNLYNYNLLHSILLCILSIWNYLIGFICTILIYGVLYCYVFS